MSDQDAIHPKDDVTLADSNATTGTDAEPRDRLNDLSLEVAEPTTTDEAPIEAGRDSETSVAEHPAASDLIADLQPAFPAYRLIRRMSEDRLGLVLKAQQHANQQTVVIRVVHDQHSPDAAAFGNLQRDIERLKALRHHHLAEIIDIGLTHDGRIYYVTEFVKGVSITEYVHIQRIGVRDWLPLFLQVCDAVGHAHQHCIVHRDLRPQDIIVDGQCRVKIFGFGLAMMTNVDIGLPTQKQDLAAVLPSLPYRTPEQLAGDRLEVDVRADVYALGVIFHELVAHAPPADLQHDNADALIKAIRDRTRPRVAADHPNLTGELAAIFQRATAPVPDERYPNMQAFADDARNFLAHRPVYAADPTRTYKARRFVRRHAGLLGVLCVIAFSFLVGLGVLSTAYQKNELVRVAAERDEVQAAHTTLVTERNQFAGALEDARMQLEALQSQRGELGQQLAETEQTLARARAESARFTAAHQAALDRTDHAQRTIEAFANLFGDALPALASADAESRTAYLAALPQHAETALEDQPRVLAVLRQRMATAAENAGNLDDAAAHYRAAYDLRRKKLRATDPDTVAVLNRLTALLYRRQNWAEAEPLCAELVESAAVAFGSDDRRTLTAHFNHAVVLEQLGRLEEAESALKAVFEGRRDLLGPAHPKTRAAVERLARLLERQGRIGDAAEWRTRIEPTSP